MADHDHDPTEYNPRWQALEETYFDWRCIVCCMVALSPQHLENQHLPGTESVYFDLDNTPWVKCDKCHTPFHLQCGTWNPCKLSEINVFFVHFFAADSFRPFILCVSVDLPPPFNVCSFRLCCVSLALKMAQKKLCLATPKKKKKTPSCGGRPPAIPTTAAPPNLPQGPVAQATQNTSGTGSHHRNQKVNQWDVERMKNALEEWHYWEDRRVRMGLKHLEMSKAQIAKKYGLSPSTFGNHTLGKVQGYEHRSGGARQPQVLSAGKQLICFSTDTLFGVHVGKLI